MAKVNQVELYTVTLTGDEMNLIKLGLQVGLDYSVFVETNDDAVTLLDELEGPR